MNRRWVWEDPLDHPEHVLRKYLSKKYRSVNEIVRDVPPELGLGLGELTRMLTDDPLIACQFGLYRYCWPGKEHVLELLKLAYEASSNEPGSRISVSRFYNANRRKLLDLDLRCGEEVRKIFAYVGVSLCNDVFSSENVDYVLKDVMKSWAAPDSSTEFAGEESVTREIKESQPVHGSSSTDFNGWIPGSSGVGSPDSSVHAQDSVDRGGQSQRCDVGVPLVPERKSPYNGDFSMDRTSRVRFFQALEEEMDGVPFTVAYLRKHLVKGTHWALCNLCNQMSDTQLEDLLDRSRKVKSQKIGDTTVYCMGDKPSMLSLMTTIVEKAGSMDIYDIYCTFRDEYGLNVEEASLRKNASRMMHDLGFTYLKETDTVYSKEEFRRRFDDISGQD